MPRPGYGAAWLDIDAILADEERVPLVFNAGAWRLGHLDSASATEHVDAGTVIDLPLWIAVPLRRSDLAAVHLPKNFSSRMRHSLNADPDNVKLRDKSPYFYETGLKLAEVCQEEDVKDLPAAIKRTLATRMHRILIKSHNSLSADVSAYVNTLTDLERRLFWTGFAYVHDRLAWKKRLTSVIRAVGVILGSSGADALGIGVASKKQRVK